MLQNQVNFRLQLIIVKALRIARGLVKCTSATQQNCYNKKKNKAKINKFGMSA